MTETTSQVEESTTNTQVEAVEPTLDDLYKESGIEASQTQTQTQQFQAQPQVQTQTQTETNVPDPFDVDNHKAYLANIERTLRETKASQDAITNAIQAERQKAYVAQMENDIQQASDFVAKESGIENVNLATFELNERARTDAKFKALWEGRNSSPQAKAAFTKALGVVSREISKKYEVRTDPQLVANRKALAASRQTSATTSQEDSNEPSWGSANGAEFQANWERMVRGHN